MSRGRGEPHGTPRQRGRRPLKREERKEKYDKYDVTELREYFSGGTNLTGACGKRLLCLAATHIVHDRPGGRCNFNDNHANPQPGPEAGSTRPPAAQVSSFTEKRVGGGRERMPEGRWCCTSGTAALRTVGVSSGLLSLSVR